MLGEVKSNKLLMAAAADAIELNKKVAQVQSWRHWVVGISQASAAPQLPESEHIFYSPHPQVDEDILTSQEAVMSFCRLGTQGG